MQNVLITFLCFVILVFRFGGVFHHATHDLDAFAGFRNPITETLFSYPRNAAFVLVRGGGAALLGVAVVSLAHDIAKATRQTGSLAADCYHL